MTYMKSAPLFMVSTLETVALAATSESFRNPILLDWCDYAALRGSGGHPAIRCFAKDQLRTNGSCGSRPISASWTCTLHKDCRCQR